MTLILAHLLAQGVMLAWPAGMRENRNTLYEGFALKPLNFILFYFFCINLKKDYIYLFPKATICLQ